ncbi:LIG3 [Mytilus edulis]|uniref:DNA ligase n=1 Tax=Mytilus edulis TaxID=6550 RepID=A0A8S3SM35_MYTED|nr:LIG3 [Mytilus edulis]
MLKTLLRTSCINGRSVPRKQISGCFLSRNVNLSWFAANNQQERLLRQFSLSLESHISLQYDHVKIQYYLFKLVRNFQSSNKWNNKYIVNYAKEGTTKCKKCKTKIETGDLRVGKVVTNPLSKGAGDMKLWYHPRCMVETFKLTTTMIEKMEGFGDLELEAKDNITKLINESKSVLKKTESMKTSNSAYQKKKPTTSTKSSQKVLKSVYSPSSPTDLLEADIDLSAAGRGQESLNCDVGNPGDSLENFRKLCEDIAAEKSYLVKTQKVSSLLKEGPEGDGFKGDAYLWLKLLLPGFVKRVYNLKSKQLVKLFSQILDTSCEDMVEDLNQGDVAETIKTFLEQSQMILPQKRSTLMLKEIDQYLEELTKVRKEDDQIQILREVTQRCTADDIKMFVRLITRDLKMNAGAKIILNGLDKNAYDAFQASRDLKDVVQRVKHGQSKPGNSEPINIRTLLMTPVLPMLAQPCRSIEQAFKKCPNGMYAEMKYDGERVQVHKKGDNFSYFSRNLKPVLDHKVKHFSEYIPQAFPSGDDLILDAEVVLIDNETSNPLPFGNLGVHKKAKFQDAQVCLFVFDCLLINGENIMHKPIKERRKLLQDEMMVIKNRVMLSEMRLINDPDDLQDMMDDVFSQGLEGLVLKDINVRCLFTRKETLAKSKEGLLRGGKMADSADLIVLGAYYGTGNKGGLMSIFLMGAYNPHTKKFCTVTKCSSGLDDKTLEELQFQLEVVKINKDVTKVPNWLHVNKSLVPDFVVKDPRESPIWEIIGAEFSKSPAHTADGISIRFPRIAEVRDDKTWEYATDVPMLQDLFNKSKEASDIVTSKKGKSSSGTSNKKK